MTDKTDVWAQAMAESENPDARDAGLWARCFAENGGDESKARAAYVNAKVEKSKPVSDGVTWGQVSRPKEPSPPPGPQIVKMAKSRGVYIILGLFFGCLGIHNFYAGRLGVGLAQLLITLVLGWFVVGLVITAIWAIIELFMVKADGAGDPMS